MTSDLFLGVDVGGTVVKAALFDQVGNAVVTSSGSADVTTKSGGVVERDPHRIWDAAAKAIKHCTSASEVAGRRISAVGVTGFGNGLFLLDDRGEPTRNAVTAVDTRASDIVQSWRSAGLEELMWATTRQPFWAGQPLPLLRWIKDKERDSLDQARFLVQSKDYVRYRLTGTLKPERSDLGSAGLYDPVAKAIPWDLCEQLELEETRGLIRSDDVLQPGEIAGEVSPDAAAETGLPASLPVVAGTLDGLALMLGSGVTDRGQLSIIGGTWGINQVLNDGPDEDRVVFQSLAALDADEFLLVESSPNSMSNFEWFLRNLGFTGNRETPGDIYAEADSIAQRTHLSEQDPLTFLPHVFATPRHPTRTGALLGLAGEVDSDKIVRAVYEGIVFEHRLLVERLPGLDSNATPILAGGVARSTVWTQLLADVLGLPLAITDTAELGARGSAMLAATAIGLYPDHRTAATEMSRVASVVQPRTENSEILNTRFQRFKAARNLALEFNSANAMEERQAQGRSRAETAGSPNPENGEWTR